MCPPPDAHPAPQNHSHDLLDLVTLQNLVELDDGGTGLLSEMIEIFRDDTPRRIRDIVHAAENRDALDLSRAGHALKGGSGALGVNGLRNLAADLEHLGRDGSVEVGPDLAQRLESLFQASLAALEAYVNKLQKQ